ncbi:hypothetical protein OG762_36830 [Streptomyces sp. NBC_01136]|uniref:DUF6197 family protein n=1 Tax=Streptomyces sp. NBC_01136 TaxID=2903754 RepID=UPI0038630AD8|nr:hypothetical protein OG762_36830 [Streptomyces sp. NBC_01136]
MTTLAPVKATLPPRADVEALDVDTLVRQLEDYLAAHAPVPAPVLPRTAHPLVTKTTAELVAEATGHTPIAPATEIVPPGRLVRLIPHALLRIPGVRRLHGGIRRVTVEQHLALTAHLIERGWARNTYRTAGGRVCVQGAQRLLHALGYGDDDTANQAAHRIQAVLAARGIRQPYPEWNDGPDRSQVEILNLIRTAAATH